MSGDGLSIGIQGVRASFHDVAAREFFGSGIQVLECSSFGLLCSKLSQGHADFCLMAIENSIAGSILPNYSLMETHGFRIAGEVYLRIEMNLMALPGQKITDIRVVQSHPMALLQCEDFLARHPAMKVLEASDTAESAQLIAAQKLSAHAAIAGRLAASTYGLEILGEGIETNKRNYTRFLVIQRPEDFVADPRANKASVRFEAADRPGSLARVLEVFSRLGVNMTKIQSIPILGRPYEYSFHIDLEWADTALYEQSLKEISGHVIHLIRFGEYQKGKRPTA